jgi:hypothetical protein
VIVLKLNEDGILYNLMFYNTNFFMIKQKKYLLFIFLMKFTMNILKIILNYCYLNHKFHSNEHFIRDPTLMLFT